MSSSSEQTMTLKEDGVKTNEELYQKFTDLVSSWPCSPAALTRHQLYRHENGWYSPLAPMVSMMVADACFTARPTDVVVATIPKAGTTWMKAILYSMVHRREHLAGGSNHPFNSLSPHECIKFLEYQLYTHNKNPNLDKLPDPRLFATHTPYMSLPRSIVAMGCKLVYVCRDPKDVLISQWSFVNKARVRDGLETLSIEAAIDFFCHGVSLFGPYWDHVLGYWGTHLAHHEKVLFFRYEEITRDPAAHVRKLAEFLGRPFNMEEEEAGMVEAIVRLCSFDHMTRMDATKYGKTKVVFGEVDNSWFFRRGHVGDWENHLSLEMAQRIDAITEARFKDGGLRV